MPCSRCAMTVRASRTTILRVHLTARLAGIIRPNECVRDRSLHGGKVTQPDDTRASRGCLSARSLAYIRHLAHTRTGGRTGFQPGLGSRNIRASGWCHGRHREPPGRDAGLRRGPHRAPGRQARRSQHLMSAARACSAMRAPSWSWRGSRRAGSPAPTRRGGRRSCPSWYGTGRASGSTALPERQTRSEPAAAAGEPG
jgi:hypothetical protein